MKTKTLYFAALLHLALCSAASAGLTAYDGFNYGATTGDLTGKNAGTGWSGAYTDIGNSTIYNATGLTYPGLPSAGGSVNTSDGSGATTISFRNFGAAITTGETWISFLGQRNTTATGTFAGFSLYGGGTVAANAEFTIASGGTANWRLLDANNGGTTSSVDTGIATTINTTDLVVVRILWNAGAAGTEAVSVWVNPTLGITPGTPQAVRDINMSVGVDRFRIAGLNAIAHTYDEIRIGDSYADVTVPLVPTDFPLSITRTGANYDFSWPSQSGKVYDLLSSTDLSTAPATWAVYDPDGAGGNDPYDDILATAPTNLLTAVPGSGPARFFVVREKDAVPAFSITVENSGVSGNNTTNGLARLATVLATNPDHLVLYFGINDALNAAQNKLVSLPTFSANLTSMVTQAVAANVRKVYLVGIHPVNAAYVASRHPTHPELARLQDHLTDYNAAVANVATATGAIFIDWRARFLEKSPGTTIADATADNINSLLLCVANSGDDDGVHLTVAGNNFLGVRVAQALSSQVVNGDSITCMGDSVTFGFAMTGAGTATGDTYPGVLKTTLNP